MRRIYILAAILLAGCQSMGDIRQSSVWHTVPVTGAPEAAAECIAQQLEDARYMVTGRGSQLSAYLQLGLLFPETYPYFSIAVKDGVAEIRARDDLLMPDSLRRRMTEILAPCYSSKTTK